jgi:hypothetical protein
MVIRITNVVEILVNAWEQHLRLGIRVEPTFGFPFIKATLDDFDVFPTVNARGKTSLG